MATPSSLTNASALRKRESIAEGTMAFHFDKPAGFDFRPGQSIDVKLLDPPETDEEGNIRTFTLASTPADADLVVATRMRDTAFKRVLRTLPIGTEVKIDGPGGSFLLPKSSARPVVFLAGGIGITPFISMARHATREKLPHQLWLFYSNRRPEDAAFLDELVELAGQNANFRFVPTMTQVAKSQRQWEGETGKISRDLLSRHLPSPQGPIYFLAGPPAMVGALREMLIAAGVDEDDIRFEEFFGY